MQNKSIMNTLAPVVSASAPKPREPEINLSNQQFNQMLTRQMNDRAATKSATKAPEAPKPVKSPDTSNKTTVQESAPKTSTANTPATESAASKSASETKDKPDSSTTVLPANSTDAALDASAAIMALVANAGVAATTATSEKAAVEPDLLNSRARIDPRTAPDDGPSDAAIRQLVANDAGKFTNALQTAANTKTLASAEANIALVDQNSALTKLAEQPVAGNGLQATQQTAFTMAAPPGVHPGNSLTPQINNNAWNQALGQRMVWMVAGAEQSATLTLNPPDLGPLQVVLNVSNGQADASFFATQPEVRQALEAALPKLREMLGDAGISLGQANVSSGSPHPQNSSDQRDNGSRRSAQSDASGLPGTPAVTARRITSAGDSMVDTFA